MAPWWLVIFPAGCSGSCKRLWQVNLHLTQDDGLLCFLFTAAGYKPDFLKRSVLHYNNLRTNKKVQRCLNTRDKTYSSCEVLHKEGLVLLRESIAYLALQPAYKCTKLSLPFPHFGFCMHTCNTGCVYGNKGMCHSFLLPGSYRGGWVIFNVRWSTEINNGQ